MFDALYDRAAVTALTHEVRPEYVGRVHEALKPGAPCVVVVIERPGKDASEGPPFTTTPDHFRQQWLEAPGHPFEKVHVQPGTDDEPGQEMVYILRRLDA